MMNIEKDFNSNMTSLWAQTDSAFFNKGGVVWFTRNVHELRVSDLTYKHCILSMDNG